MTENPVNPSPFWERGCVVLANAGGYLEDSQLTLIKLLSKGWRIDPYLAFQKCESGQVVWIALSHDGEVDTSKLNPFLDKPLVSEPEKVGEFDAVVGTLSLPHGESPPQPHVWRVYKVYEKSTIWLQLREVKKS
jgi:hypothetical protein